MTPILRTISALFLFLALCLPLSLAAQRAIVGSVVAERDGQPIALATLRLLSLPDSTLLTGTQSDTLGRFALSTSHQGAVLLQASFLGLGQAQQQLQLTAPIAGTDTLRLAPLRLQGSDIALQTATALATLARVEQRGDTTQFNAAAFRTPEGSTLEALLKLLPGAEVGSDGSIKINGKEVKELLVNGKDFFKGDTKVALKNLPTTLVSKVKAYDKKSDYAEATGVDDGEENFVLDLQTRRELNQSFVSNLDLGQGHDLEGQALRSYKIFASRFSDHSRITGFLSHNNVGDRGFGGPGFNQQGLTTSTMGGIDFNWDNGKKNFASGRLELSGSAYLSRSDNDSERLTSSETFLAVGRKASFANSHSWQNTLQESFRTHLRFKWNPDSLTQLSLRPSFAWNQRTHRQHSRSATFDADPFASYRAQGSNQVLDSAFAQPQALVASPFLVNLNQRQNHGQQETHDFSTSLELSRRLPSKPGRVVGLDARANYQRTADHAYSLSQLHTRQSSQGLSPSGIHQFSTAPAIDWGYRTELSYVEPLWGQLLAEARYGYEYKYTDGSRTLSHLQPLAAQGNRYGTLAQFIADHSHYAGLYALGADALHQSDPALTLSSLSASDLYAALRDAANSQAATYRYERHEAQLRLRYNTPQLRLTLGLGLTPERTRLSYSRPALGQIDTLRSVMNLSPQLRLRYNFSKTTRLDLNYRGRSAQPSMTQLLNVVDSSDPLHISLGNLGLRPSWTDNLRFSFNSYDPQLQRGWMAHAYFSNTRNPLSILLLYEPTTGRRFTRPENVSGHWNLGTNLTYSTPLDRQRLLNFSTTTTASLSRSVGYIASQITSPTALDFASLSQLFATAALDRNVARTSLLTQRLTMAYRRTTWDLSLNASANYKHTTTTLQSQAPLNLWSLTYGAQVNAQLPWGFQLSTDVEMNTRRGFADQQLNTSELVWNLQLSRAFLRNKALTLSLKAYDLLNQQSQVSRTITALMRQDQWHNSLNRYLMLHLVYKLNLFEGSKGSKHPDNQPEPTDRPMRRGRPEGGYAYPRGERPSF